MTKLTERPGCILGLLQWLGLAPKPQSGLKVTIVTKTETGFDLPYRRRDDFLSPAELSFYHVLKTAVGENAVICPKVGIAEVLFVAQPNVNKAYRSKIVQKHFDFVICAPTTLRPLAAIELDDASHARPDRQARDEFVQAACDAASLPLVRFPVRHTYNTHEIAAQLAGHLNNGQSAPTSKANGSDAPASTSTNAAPPICPKCGVPMVKRAARNEPTRHFYGCQNYPQCRVIIPIAE